MGWFFINVVLPVGVPIAYLLGAKFVDLPKPYASRIRLICAVQDGQLGWIATVFAAACVYELLDRLQDKRTAPGWVSLVFGIACAFLAISGFMAALGTLFPVNESKHKPAGAAAWLWHFRLFVATAVATVITAALFSLAHYTLPARCDRPGLPEKETRNESSSKIFAK